MNLRKFSKFNESIDLPNINDFNPDKVDDMIKLVLFTKEAQQKISNSIDQFIFKETPEFEDRILSFIESYGLKYRFVRASTYKHIMVVIEYEEYYSKIRENEKFKSQFVNELCETVIRLYNRYSFIRLALINSYRGSLDDFNKNKLDLKMVNESPDKHDELKLKEYIESRISECNKIEIKLDLRI